jgi:hypothetical protein
MRDVTVLITACGNVYMPGTAASIKNNGERNVRLIGADMNHDDTILQMFDQYYQVPRGDDPSYADVLLDICKKEHVDVVIPIMSVELEALAKNAEQNDSIIQMPPDPQLDEPRGENAVEQTEIEDIIRWAKEFPEKVTPDITNIIQREQENTPNYKMAEGKLKFKDIQFIINETIKRLK